MHLLASYIELSHTILNEASQYLFTFSAYLCDFYYANQERGHERRSLAATQRSIIMFVSHVLYI